MLVLGGLFPLLFCSGTLITIVILNRQSLLFIYRLDFSIMYTAKLFDDLFAYKPVVIINDNKSKTLLEALQNAINKSADFNAIIRIDMYNDGVYVDTSVLKDGNFIY